jgi:predicted MPP superfamily phosphohydrolase
VFAVFLGAYFVVYGGMHAYVLRKLYRGFPLSGWITAALILFSVACLLAPMAVHAVDRRGPILAARLLATVCWTTMGLVFWFFAFGLAVDLWDLVVGGLCRVGWIPLGLRLLVGPRNLPLVVLALISAAAVWGLFEARAVRLKTVVFRSARLPAASPCLRLALVSDVHAGLVLRPDCLTPVLALLERTQPDLLLCAGDLVDAATECVSQQIEPFARISPPLGRFAVLGNHEGYAGVAASVKSLRQAGFTVLRDEWVLLGEHLAVAGVDDPACYRSPRASSAGEDRAVAGIQGADRVRILLKHQPMVRESARGRFDLQLSGHTHAGQIFPFGWVVALFHPWGPGLHQLGADSALYVSRGTGTWGPPFRLLAPPEVTLIVIEPRPAAGP